MNKNIYPLSILTEKRIKIIALSPLGLTPFIEKKEQKDFQRCVVPSPFVIS